VQPVVIAYWLELNLTSHLEQLVGLLHVPLFPVTCHVNVRLVCIYCMLDLYYSCSTVDLEWVDLGRCSHRLVRQLLRNMLREGLWVHLSLALSLASS
jgi:hypothetical protein